MSELARKPRFWNYPLPKQGPDVPYQNNAPPNPVLRGYPLAIAVWIFISGILYRNAKFGKLKEIKELREYAPRHDPTVIPILDESSPEETSSHNLPDPKPRLNENQHYTSADYVSAYKSGKLSPTDVVEVLIPLISRDLKGEHSIAFLECRADLVRKAAEASTRRYQEGTSLGPLDGVPVAVKDEVDLKGYKRTLGSTLDFTNKTDETAWCVKQWEEAGAIVIGKTNMHEIGLDTTNNNPHTGTPLNPHNPSHYTGGSSGGSAYAITSGLVPIALGADGGGSIRIPSSLCGIYGLKPSHGRVSGRPTLDLGVSVGVYGPMASSIADLRLAYRVMARPDPGDASSGMFPAASPPPSGKQDSNKKKYLGLCTPWLRRAAPEILALTHRAIAHYTTQHDYTAVEIPLPFLPESQKAHALTILSEIGSHFSAEAASSSSEAKAPRISNLSLPARLVLTTTGAHASAADFLAAQQLRCLLMAHLAWLWQTWPGMLVVTPTLPERGMAIRDRTRDVRMGAGGGVSDSDASLRSMEYVFVANWVGCPALSAVVGYVDGGMGEGGRDGGERRGKGAVPVGLMAMGEWGAEEALMDWAEEGSGFLERDMDMEEGATATTAEGGREPGGVRQPRGRDGAWVDVLGMAAALKK